MSSNDNYIHVFPASFYKLCFSPPTHPPTTHHLKASPADIEVIKNVLEMLDPMQCKCRSCGEMDMARDRAVGGEQHAIVLWDNGGKCGAEGSSPGIGMKGCTCGAVEENEDCNYPKSY